ncbi:sigma-70 family RNA polymerase sigma factor [Paludisphaera sp.]|uniref:sigma-70 family RNA polymerase sigma factor n=1 Tax=Paludisphaera sp. TaxID=2017432 RepID=UPI00301D9653
MSSSRVESPLGRLLERGTCTGTDDARLLERYARSGDREAFAALAARHGPMVMGVCRRILAEPSDVDDAYQATFLVLIRRAGTLGPGDVLSAWLHGVATKVARRARMDRARRRARERDGLAVEPAREPDSRDFALREVIDQEVERLPWRYRAPVVLCYLEGLTHEEAAARLSWPVGSVKGRLARARSLLGSRLSRRGVTAGAGAIALEGLASAAVPDALAAAVALAAGRVAAGVAWNSVLSYPVVRLAKGACASMIATNSTVAALAAAALAVAMGVGAAAARSDGPTPPEPAPPPLAATVSDDPATPEPAPPSVAEPSPDEEPTRGPGGTERRQATSADRLLAAARDAFREASGDRARGGDSLDRAYRASRLWLDARLARATDADEREAAFVEHLDRIRTVARSELAGTRARGSSASGAAEARAMLAEAELWAARGDDSPGSDAPRAAGPAAGSDGPGDPDARSAAILKELEAPLWMSFPDETPLEDVLKYIRQATERDGRPTIPIYVDPIGLNEADKTMTSPVSIDLAGVPLRRTLQLMLKQIDLVYFVEDGVLVITSADAAPRGLGPDSAPPAPSLEEEVEQARRGALSMDEMQALSEKLKLLGEIRRLHREVTAPEPPAVPAPPSP